MNQTEALIFQIFFKEKFTYFLRKIKFIFKCAYTDLLFKAVGSENSSVAKHV